MGLYDIFKRLLGDRSSSDVNTGQDSRRQREDQRARRERRRELEQLLKIRGKRRRAALLTLEPLEVQSVNPTLTNVPINEIFGFEPKKRRRK